MRPIVRQETCHSTGFLSAKNFAIAGLLGRFVGLLVVRCHGGQLQKKEEHNQLQGQQEKLNRVTNGMNLKIDIPRTGAGWNWNKWTKE